MAWGGQPCAKRVTTCTTASAALCARYSAVPVVALNVLPHRRHLYRCSRWLWITMCPSSRQP